MNVQKLSIILEALRCGSMTKAAEELGYTQSGLTYTVNTVENELGFPIVIRDASGIRLSAEGQELLPYIEELVSCDHKFTQYAQGMLHRQGKTLNVATYPSTAETILPEILADFMRSDPDIKVNVRVGSQDDLIRWLSDGNVDFGFGGQFHLPGCDWLPLLEDPELAVLPGDFPTDGMTAFPMEEFHRHPFVLPIYWPEEAALVRQLEQYRIEPQFAVDFGDNAPIIAMVEQGLALSALPELTLHSYRYRIKTLPLDPPCSRIVGVNYRQLGAGQTAAHKFLHCITHWSKKFGTAQQ
ncbi:MAG: LysR family transcriptional regulator [Oscillospiraceae bacterium]|nr:LysR family transcriptional regulator [Oscillospiraceae bacterium]